MSEMIDLVEDAISEACHHALPPHYLAKCARAAIEAMREPTMAMESAASNWQGPQMTYSDVWRAMIDEALK